MAGFSNGRTGVKNGNGKRERVDQEDDQEFMPLSKRINNIHLSPERMVHGATSALYLQTNGISAPLVHHPLSNEYSNGILTRQIGDVYEHHQANGFRGVSTPEVADFNDTSGDGGDSLHSSSSPEQNLNYQNASASNVPVMPSQSPAVDRDNEFSNYQYRPSLNQRANPHYYEANRTLFELYIERQLRTNQVPHSNVFGPPSSNGVN